MDLSMLADKTMEIHRMARLYLVDHIGNMTYPTTPRYDELRKRWFVSILCETDKGALPVGALEFDAEGCLASAPSAEQVEEIARRIHQETPVLVRGEAERLTTAGFEVVRA